MRSKVRSSGNVMVTVSNVLTTEQIIYFSMRSCRLGHVAGLIIAFLSLIDDATNILH